MEKWYWWSTRKYRVTARCETIGWRNRAGDCQSHSCCDVLAGQAFEPINDHAFFGNACVELIGHQTNLHHQTGCIRPDLHGCHAPGRLGEADRVPARRCSLDPRVLQLWRGRATGYRLWCRRTDARRTLRTRSLLSENAHPVKR